MTKLYSTPEREKILVFLLYNPKPKITMRQIAKKLSISHSQVHKYITMLKKMRIVKDMELIETPFVRSLRLTQNIIRLEKVKVAKILRKRVKDITGIGIFGSWANGSNTSTSDVDIWIKVRKEPELITIAEARRELEKIGAGVDFTILTEEKIRGHMERNPPFYFSLVHSMVLWGEGI